MQRGVDSGFMRRSGIGSRRGRADEEAKARESGLGVCVIVEDGNSGKRGSMTIPAAVFARLWIIGRECRLGLPVSPWMLWFSGFFRMM